MADDFFSFDEALDELRLKEEELKRLVSEGEIRAFRKGDTMKLRKSDVESLRRELSGGEVVDLGDDSAEELVFEDDSVEDNESGMATQEIADVDTLIDDVEEIVELDLEEDESAPVAVAPVRRHGGVSAAPTEEETEGMGVLVALLATAVVFILALPVALSVTSGDAQGLARSIAEVFGNEFAGSPDSAPE